MDKNNFEERAARLREVGKLIESLPAEIRALAFPLLSDYVAAGMSSKNVSIKPEALHSAPLHVSDRAEFFRTFDHDKPADNAKLLAAWHFSQFGNETFTADEIKALAAEVGITIPDRVDKTLAMARENGKHLFHKTGKNIKPTVHGETYLKATYNIGKGTGTKPQVEISE